MPCHFVTLHIFARHTAFITIIITNYIIDNITSPILCQFDQSSLPPYHHVIITSPSPSSFYLFTAHTRFCLPSLFTERGACIHAFTRLRHYGMATSIAATPPLLAAS